MKESCLFLLACGKGCVETGYRTECERGNKGNTVLWRGRIVRLRHLVGMQDSNMGRADFVKGKVVRKGSSQGHNHFALARSRAALIRGVNVRSGSAPLKNGCYCRLISTEGLRLLKPNEPVRELAHRVASRHRPPMSWRGNP